MGQMPQMQKRRRGVPNTRAPRLLILKLNSFLQAPFGFSVMGISTHNKDGVKRWNKAFGQSLSSINIDYLLANFIRLDKEQSILVAEIFLKKLEEFVDFFGSQRRYHFYASSLLFIYDFDSLQIGNMEKFKGSVKLKLIDFAHVFPANGVADDNFIHGLKNLCELFQKLVSLNKNSDL